MDQAYTTKSPTRSHLDRERRRPLYFAVSRDAGLPNTIGIARVWHFIDVHCFIITAFSSHHAFRYRKMAAYCANFAARPLTGMEHVGALRNVPPAAGAKRVLGLQLIAADRLFHCRLCFWPFGDSYRDRYVACWVNRFPWYARVFGGRQSARSIHFLTMFSFLAFLVCTSL